MVHIEEHKEPQHNIASENFLSPDKLYLPLSQHIGQIAQPLVKKGDLVEEGTAIALETGFISARLHASCSGKVLDIDNYHHPNLKKCNTIMIQCSGEKKTYSPRKQVYELTKDDFINIIKDNGIVGMGGAGFPAHVKLKPPKPIDTLLINGCECEPYLSSDNRLMMENTDEIFQGVAVICKIINPRRVLFGIENNKPEAIKKMNLMITIKKHNLPKPETVVLKSGYPQGGEKQLIYKVTGRKVPPAGLPFDVGCLVHNVATCFAIYEAVYLNKPLTARLVSFSGDALKSAKNLWVKIGTTLKEIFDKKILEFKNDPEKIICGGPMMGVSLDSLDYPILKGTGGFLFLRENVFVQEETSCIRCARCVDVCPMNLLPLEYAKRVKKEEYNNLVEFNINDCIECGICSYVCPAKIPLVHYIKLGKKYMPKK